jgi:alpha-L-fucosidase 2
MAWTCDFHLDINTQQNYWPAEVCNLGECHEPLLRLVESLRTPGRRTARAMYDCDGWVCHVVTNAWGFTAPGWGLGWGLHVTGGVWLASHLWEHYQFTGDREFLSRRAYPALKEAAEFFLDYMVQNPDYGWLVTGPAVSPENAFYSPAGERCAESMGPTCDSVLVRDLFTCCVEASRILDVDPEFRKELQSALRKLPPLRVGKHDQLMEWLEDFDEAVPNHRHMTHLIALYPSDQITVDETPELAKAARVTIDRRVNRPDWEDVEWSRGNLINFHARLREGEMAHDSLLALLRTLTDANLLTFSVGGIAGASRNIFVLDGNTSGTAGIAEMLLQSHKGTVHLLPALPRAWPTGSVKGLRARGGFEIDIDWRDGSLHEAAVASLNGNMLRIRYGETVREVDTRRGQRLQFNADLGSRSSGGE